MTLPEWLQMGVDLEALYQAELGRSIFSDPEAFVNWAFWLRDGGSELAGVRRAIRESPEWKTKHDGPPPLPDVPPQPPPAASGFGLLEHVSSTVVRPRLTRDQIAAFVPSRGPFVFPGYGTRGIRLTNAEDGIVYPLGMAYWPVVNNHAGRLELRVLLSINGELAVLTVDKALGRVIDSAFIPFGGTGEGAYWSVSNPDQLYVPQAGGLIRYNVSTRQVEVAVSTVGDTTQFHSSADGAVHSCTLNGHAAVFDHGVRRPFPSPNGGYDECQIDKSGRWLLIKEGAGENRIVDLRTGREWTITNAQGAVGHSDMGFSYVIGEDDQTNPGGVFRLWHFTEAGPVDGGPVYATEWTGMTRYVSHTCAAARPHRFLFSSAHDGDALRANELVVVDFDGSGRCRSVCSNLTDLNAPDPHGADNKYWRKTRAVICPVGEYGAFTANLGTERIDAFLVQL